MEQPVGDSARSAALAFLDEHNAASVEHLQGTLLEHLLRVEDLLRRWGGSEALALAALCHATYGTDGFAPNLLELDGRDRLREVIGPEAEETVYFYASCDRAVVYPRLADDPVRYRDRFTDTEFDATPSQMRDFVDLTVANEVEIAVSAGNPTEWTWLADFCKMTQHLASPPVFAGAAVLLGIG